MLEINCGFCRGKIEETNLTLQISDEVRALGAKEYSAIGPQLDQIDAVAIVKHPKGIGCISKHRGIRKRLCRHHWLTGTMIPGRDKLDAVYADDFGCEDALVRIGLCQRHPCHRRRPFSAFCVRATSWCRPSACPTITLQSVIGLTDKRRSSLKEYGDHLPSGRTDSPGKARSGRHRTDGRIAGREGGFHSALPAAYSTRASLSVEKSAPSAKP
jgi:hypothetical protein